MAAPQAYRLQALLQIREREEEAAKQAFAEAVNHLREQERILEEHQQELKRMVEDRLQRRQEYARKLAAGEMKITDQSGAYRFIDRLKEREQEQQGVIDGQKENVREAENDVKRAQDNLVTATQNLKALLKHKEKWQEARKRALQMKEENMLDEIAQTIFQKNQSGD